MRSDSTAVLIRCSRIVLFRSSLLFQDARDAESEMAKLTAQEGLSEMQEVPHSTPCAAKQRFIAHVHGRFPLQSTVWIHNILVFLAAAAASRSRYD